MAGRGQEEDGVTLSGGRLCCRARPRLYGSSSPCSLMNILWNYRKSNAGAKKIINKNTAEFQQNGRDFPSRKKSEDDPKRV